MQTKTCPSKIFFFCGEPAPEGGETSIVPSHIIVTKMEERLPELMAKMSEVGFLFRIKTASDNETDGNQVVNKTWKWILKTDDEVEAQKRYAVKMLLVIVLSSISAIERYSAKTRKFC